jgi:cytochrome P450
MIALPVPSLVISELLAVPYADRAEFQDRSARLLDVSLPEEQRIAARWEDRAYMAGLVARSQADPGEDMLGMLSRRWRTTPTERVRHHLSNVGRHRHGTGFRAARRALSTPCARLVVQPTWTARSA